MKNPIIIQSLIFFLFHLNAFGNSPIIVVENTLKIKGLSEEIFYYGFAEGDEIIFGFEELNGKELKDIEVSEIPTSSIFMEYKIKKVEDKKFTIKNTGIYKFRFANSAIGGRVCRFKIQRIPADTTTIDFNTNVFWKTVYDTTYTIEQERYLIKTDTIISNLADMNAKVHSTTNLNSNKNTLTFTLPPNTVAWSYYIGVDQNGQEAYEKATNELARNVAPLLSSVPGYGPLASLALNGTSYLTQLQKGEDIDYSLVNAQTGEIIKKGKVINDYAKISAPLNGKIWIYLSNDNAVTGVSGTPRSVRFKYKPSNMKGLHRPLCRSV